ncbi:hypothetical protein RI054_04g24020 [Pseudoscourfieldia marina]
MARPRIPDNLDDVEDDEEDEEWKEWGTPKAKPTPEPEEVSGGGGMNVEDIMKYVQKQKQTRDLDTLGMGANGMQLCFIRLKPDPKRTKEDADVIAGRWKSLLMTAASEEALYSIDKDTLLISVDGSRLKEARKFVLTRPEAAEFEHQSTTWVLAGNDGDDDDDNDGEPKFKVQNRNTATKPPPPPPNPADVLKQTTTDKKNKKDKKKDKKKKKKSSKKKKEKEKEEL